MPHFKPHSIKTSSSRSKKLMMRANEKGRGLTIRTKMMADPLQPLLISISSKYSVISETEKKFAANFIYLSSSVPKKNIFQNQAWNLVKSIYMDCLFITTDIYYLYREKVLFAHFLSYLWNKISKHLKNVFI